MKLARKMVLVDVNSLKDSTSTAAINELTAAVKSLVTSNEFSKSEYGNKATLLASLDKELKDILARNDLDDSVLFQLYNQKLQKYLFHIRENERKTPVLTGGPVSAETGSEIYEEEGDTYSFNSGERPEPVFSVPQSVKQVSTSEIFTGTPSSSKTPFYFTGRKKLQSNLPRNTPIRERLRTSAQRQKTARYKDFLANWEEYDSE